MSNKLKYLDKKGLAKVFSLIKFGHKKIWHGTQDEWDALPAEEKAKYDQAEVIDEYTGVPVVVDKVEAGNLNPVTSNAVAEALSSGAGGAGGTGGAAGNPDYEHPKAISSYTWTTDEDVWVNYTNSYSSGSSGETACPLYANDSVISTAITITAASKTTIYTFAGRIPKGTVLKATGLNSAHFRAWPFKA